LKGENYAIKWMKYNLANQCIEETFFDTQSNPSDLEEGYCKIVHTYENNDQKTTHYNTKGEVVEVKKKDEKKE